MDGEMIEMTLSSRHRIRNSSPGGLRPHNTNFHTWMGKKQFCFFQTAETGNRAPDSGVKGSGANHYPRAPALKHPEAVAQSSVTSLFCIHTSIRVYLNVDLPLLSHHVEDVFQPFTRYILLITFSPTYSGLSLPQPTTYF